MVISKIARTKETFRDKISSQTAGSQDGIAVKPPPIPFEFSANHEGWKYWLDHVRGF